MFYLKVFLIAFVATIGFEMALGLCMIIGEICKGVSKNEQH